MTNPEPSLWKMDNTIRTTIFCSKNVEHCNELFKAVYLWKLAWKIVQSTQFITLFFPVRLFYPNPIKPWLKHCWRHAIIWHNLLLFSLSNSVVFVWVLEVNQVCFGFSLLNDVIWLENLHHLHKPSDTKLKPITSLEFAFSCDSGNLCCFHMLG